MTAPPRLAVVIVSWNTRELLARCLESLAPEARAGRARVIVVDNASKDGSAELVRERFDWVELIASEENLGFGPAVNLGARRAGGEWLAIANADIALRPGALDALLEAGRRDLAAGAIAPRLILPDGTTQHSVFGFPTVPFTLFFALGGYRLWPGMADRLAMSQAWDGTRARRVPWAVAAFLLVRRSAWEQVGGFDDRQWMYAEDLDLGWRLRQAGWRTRYEPRAEVEHESAASTTQMFGADLAPHWQRATYGWMARRRGVTRTRAVALLQIAGVGGRWARHALLARRDPEHHVAARDAWRAWLGVHLVGLRSRRRVEELR